MTQTESDLEAELVALSQLSASVVGLRYVRSSRAERYGPFLLLVNHYFHLWRAELADRLSKEEGEKLERLLGRLQAVVRPDRCLHNNR